MSLKEFKQTDLHCIYCGTKDVYRDELGETSASGQHYCVTCGNTFRTCKQPLNAFTTARMVVLLDELQRKSPVVCGSCKHFKQQKDLWYEDKLKGRRAAGVCACREEIVSHDYHCSLYLAQ